jgi:pimeloyl-ACP methyl ester carboxylesterase
VHPALRTGRFVEVQPGIRLHCAEAGQPGRPLIVFLHGFPEFWGAWKDILPAFAASWHAVAPDLRGYHLSSKPPEVSDYRIDALVADIDGLIGALGHSACVLVGHDWGGALAWAVAMTRPHRVRRLIILNAPHPVPFARQLAQNPEQQRASTYMDLLRAPGSEDQLAGQDFAQLEAFLAADGVLPAWYDPPTRAAYHAAWGQPDALRSALNYYRATPLRAARTGMATGELKATEAVKLPVLDPQHFMVRMPTRVIWGEQDRALRPSLLEGLDEVVPDLEMVRLPRATHWLIHESPERITALIREFAERQDA